MKPSSKQESVIMVKETFLPRSGKFQLMFFLLVLVLVALAFAAGVLFRPFITSHCGIRHGDDGDKVHSVRGKRTSSVCMTNEDFTNLVEKARASLKSSLPKASKGTNSLHEIDLPRREPPRITEGIEKGKLKKDLKVLIIANLTAYLNRTLTEILSEKLGECARGGDSQETTRNPSARVGQRHETTRRPTLIHINSVKPTTSQTSTKGPDFNTLKPGPEVIDKVDESGSGSGSGSEIFIFDKEETHCPDGWSKFEHSCYTINNAAPTQNWQRAKQACTSMDASLVVINSHEENLFVYQLAQQKAPSYRYMWIGLYRPSPWEKFRWLRFVDSTFGYHNWAKGEPNNDRGNGENCVHMYLTNFKNRQAQWNDEKCLNPGNGGPMVYMCERPATTEIQTTRNPSARVEERHETTRRPTLIHINSVKPTTSQTSTTGPDFNTLKPGPDVIDKVDESGHGSGSGSGIFIFDKEETHCPDGWSKFEHSCYTINNAAPTQNWQRAKQACTSMDASLVVINSHEENLFVYQLAQQKAPSYRYMWIGLYRPSPWEKFRWLRFVDSTLCYHNWAKGEPNNDRGNGENCVHMYLTNFKNRQAQWNDEKCLNPGNGGPMVYMCERPATTEESSGQEKPHQAVGESFILSDAIPSEDDDIYIL